MSIPDEVTPAALLDRVRRLERRLARQTSARENAEALLEGKSLELFELNRALAQLNAGLEQRVRERTQELDQERRHALFLAERDLLTGLPNRLMFSQRLQHVLEHRDGPGSVALLYLDLDGFKAVNDTLGHASGDELLKAVGRRLAALPGEGVLAARLGGDEFAIIQTALDRPEQAVTLANSVIAALQVPFELNDREVRVGVTVGIAVTSEADENTETLLHNADIALYNAKEKRRGTWELFSPEMDLERLSRLAMERDLRAGLGVSLGEGQFELFYQPLLEANGGGLVGFEALLRWRHPERGLVPPAAFIPVAEEIGLIHEIGAWVLKKACSDAAAWAPHLRVAVNLSPVQFAKGDLLGGVQEALTLSGLKPDRLELEITESVLLQDSEATLCTLHKLRSLGIRIAMDDFGTGYSSLSYLRRFPFDKIKIDRSFVQAMAQDEGSIAIIRAVIGLGRALRIKVLAEGVETNEQRELLCFEGCDELQGFLFSKPRPLDELGALLASVLRQTAPAAPPSKLAKGAA